MQLHLVRYTGGGRDGLELGLGDETQTIQRSDSRLDPPDEGSEPGARLRRAGFEESRLSAAGMVRRAARIVALPERRVAAGRTGEADAASAIFDLTADRPAGG